MELIEEEGMMELIKVIKKPRPSKGDTRTLSFIMKNQDQDILTHISISPLVYANIEEMTPKGY